MAYVRIPGLCPRRHRLSLRRCSSCLRDGFRTMLDICHCAFTEGIPSNHLPARFVESFPLGPAIPMSDIKTTSPSAAT